MNGHNSKRQLRASTLSSSFVRAVYASGQSHLLGTVTIKDDAPLTRNLTVQASAARPFRQSESDFNSAFTNKIMEAGY